MNTFSPITGFIMKVTVGSKDVWFYSIGITCFPKCHRIVALDFILILYRGAVSVGATWQLEGI